MWLVLYSKFNAFKQNVHDRAKFYKKDLWKTNLNPYDHIIIFGVEQMVILFTYNFLK